MGETRVGTDIAGYRIEGVIGRGRMGVVYGAHRAFPDRRVALKVLSPDLAADPSFRERFLREASAAASTEHPNIVPVYAAGEAEGTLFLAMRLVEGTDLRRWLAEGPIEPGTAVRIISQIADALDAAHERGLVHRDVKPGNVLLDRAGAAYLVDSGLVRRVTGTTFTQSGQFTGSIDYCASGSQVRRRR